MTTVQTSGLRWRRSFLLSLASGAISGWVGAALFLSVIASPFVLLLPGMGLYVTVGIPMGALCGAVGGSLLPILRGLGRWRSALLFSVAWGFTGALEWWAFSTIGRDYSYNESALLSVLATSLGIGAYMLLTGWTAGFFLLFRMPITRSNAL
jgi:hypothetical protein